MNYISKFAEGFMHLFQLGGETFISWMTGIVPVVLMLLVAMNNCFLGRRTRKSYCSGFNKESGKPLYDTSIYICFCARQSNGN